MSYTIFYRSMFVKMSDGRYIPLIESGSNNCTEITWKGRERRERSWHQCMFGNGSKSLARTRDEIMRDVESVIDKEKERVGKPYASYENKEGVYTEQEIEKHFGYYSGIAISGNGHCNNTSAQQFRNFFLKGFEQAVTFDECEELKLTWCTGYPNYERCNVKSEEELMTVYEGLTIPGCHVTVSFCRWTEYLWDKHRKRAEKKPQEPKTVGFVVQFGSQYIHKLSSRHMWRTSYLDSAKKYASRVSADRAAECLNKNYDSVTQTAYTVPVRINNEGHWEQAA